MWLQGRKDTQRWVMRVISWRLYSGGRERGRERGGSEAQRETFVLLFICHGKWRGQICVSEDDVCSCSEDRLKKRDGEDKEHVMWIGKPWELVLGQGDRGNEKEQAICQPQALIVEEWLTESGDGMSWERDNWWWWCLLSLLLLSLDSQVSLIIWPDKAGIKHKIETI